jgi:hypothetical protein
MMYPGSPGLQTLPVPGVGFCQSIFVDQRAAHRGNRGLWSFIANPFSVEQAPQETGELPMQRRLQ